MEEALTSSMKKIANSSVLTDTLSLMAQKGRNVDSLKRSGYLRVALFLSCSILAIEWLKKGNLQKDTLNAVYPFRS